MAGANGTGANAAGSNAGTDSSAASTSSTTANSANPSKPETVTAESDMQQLRELIEAQAAQLQEQQRELKDQQQEMQALKQQLNSSGSTNGGTLGAAPVVAAAPAMIGPVVGVPVAMAAVTSPSAQPAQAPAAATDQPTSWPFKGVTFTPIGFFAAESAWRQRALSADVNTPFTSIPMPGASPYNVSEFNASGRQSRIGMLVQGKLSKVTMGGYYEADFLSAGITSNNNQSNSYTLRQRQFWGQAAFNSGFTITGGQMWSLVTQTAKGVDPRTEVLPETIDAQYSVGFSWARQYGVRFAKNFNNKMWVAMAVEAPQISFKGSGTTTPFLFGEPGTGGGLYNATTGNYSFNMTPDFIFKAAFEPGFGHYELFGLVSTFRDRIFPTGAAAYNNNTVGGGGGANAWFPFDHAHVNLGLHVLAGNGVGRYGSAQSAPDVTAQPNGTFATVTSYQGLATLAFHYPKWDVYFHVGEEYGDRTQFISGTSTFPNEGFGATGFNNTGCWTEAAAGSGGYAPTSPSNCANNIKDIIEGTAGVWYSFYTGPKGTFKFGLQYSNVAYNTWPGFNTGAPTGACATVAHPSCAPSTNDNMVFTSMRYYIP
jgi:hypothetical protein